MDKPVEVLLEDGVSLNGVIETTDDGFAVIANDSTRERIRINLAKVKGINPEQVDSTETKFKIQANIGIRIEDGNTEKEKLHLDGELEARRQRLRYNLGFEYDFETNNDKKTKRNYWHLPISTIFLTVPGISTAKALMNLMNLKI